MQVSEVCRVFTVNVSPEENVLGLANSIGAVLFTIRVLEGLLNASSHQITFNVAANGYGNIVPGLFQPRHQISCSNIAVPVDAIPVFLGCCHGTEQFKVPRKAESYQMVHDVFQKYFKIKELPFPLIPNATLGLHYRGTDRMASGMTVPISQAEFVIMLKDFLVHHSFTTFYVASDVEDFVKLLYREFPTHNIISFDQRRASSNSSRGLHFTLMDAATTEVMAEAALIDLVSLSRCTHVFKTSSIFSAFAKVLNPSVKLLTVSGNGLYPLFPEGVSTNEYSMMNMSQAAADILHRTMTKPKDYLARSAAYPAAVCRLANCSWLQANYMSPFDVRDQVYGMKG